MLRRIRFRPNPYAVSVLLVFVSTVLTQWLDPILADQTLLFLAAVGISGWYGGLKPGILTAILSTLSIDFFFIPPVHTLAIASLEDGIRWVIFLLVALISCLPGTQLERAKQQIQMTGTVMDIDDRKHAEAILRQYERIVSSTPDGIALVDRTYTYRLVNQTYLSANQKQREEIVGHTVSELMGDEIFQAVVQPQFDRCLAGETIQYETWFDYPDGEQRFVSVTYAPYVEGDGTLSGVVVTGRDLTDLKRAEDKLRESEERFRIIFENAAIGIAFIAPPDYLLKLTNPFFQKLTGYSAAELMNLSPDTLTHPEDLALEEPLNQECRAGLRNHYQLEKRYIRKGGEMIWVNLTASVIFEQRHQVKYGIGMVEDITSRKATEAALRDSEEQLRSLVQDVAVGIVMFGPATEFLLSNQTALELLGKTETELSQKTVTDSDWDILCEDGSAFPMHLLPIRQAIATCQPVRGVVLGVYRRVYGDRIWLVVNAIPQLNAAGTVRYVICSFNDITARKTAEAVLQRQADQEQAFNRVVQAIRHSLDLDIIFSTAAREFAELLQLDGVGIPQYLPERHCWMPVAEHIHKPGTLSLLGVEVPDANNPITARLKQREIVLIENTYTLDDPVNQSVAQQGLPVGWLMVPLEINQRVWGCLVAIKSPVPVSFTQAEIDLARRLADQLAIAIQQANLYQQVQQFNRELEQRVAERTAQLHTALAEMLRTHNLFEATFEQSADAIFLVDSTTLLTTNCNQRAVELFEAKHKQRLIGIHGRTLHKHPFPDDDRLMARQALTLGGYWSTEVEYLSFQGRSFWGNIAASQIQVGNEQMHLVRITDISTCKQTEQALEQQLQREHLIHTISQQIRQSLHLDEILNTTVTEVRRVLQTDRVVIFRLRPNRSGHVMQESVAADLPPPADTIFPYEIFPDSVYKFYCQGNVRVILNTAEDAAGECPPDLMQQLGVKSKIVAPIVQRTHNLQPDGQSQNSLWGLLITYTYVCYRDWLPSEVDLLQQLATQLGIALQQANLYAQLENQLAQKEILLKEVHHRVKNNLQVISSMLWLQTRAAQHPALSSALADTRNRLQAMALIHETLYQSSNLGELNFHDYIQQLATNILSVHSTRPNQVNLIYHLQPVTFNLDTAIPCGLLLNELLTNAIKHAFPNGQSGEVCITLERRSLPIAAPSEPSLLASPLLASQPSATPASQESASQELQSDSYVLTIQDNGVGIPETLDLKHLKSLGLKIAHDLALQLRGSLELQRTQGTRFQLTFSALKYRKRF